MQPMQEVLEVSCHVLTQEEMNQKRGQNCSTIEADTGLIVVVDKLDIVQTRAQVQLVITSF